MLKRIALLLGVLAVPVLLALASQALATSTDPPDVPQSVSTVVATVPAVAPSVPGASESGSGAGTTRDSSAEPARRSGDGAQAVPVEPRQVGTPADLDGDRDDDGIPDEEDR